MSESSVLATTCRPVREAVTPRKLLRYRLPRLGSKEKLTESWSFSSTSSSSSTFSSSQDEEFGKKLDDILSNAELRSNLIDRLLAEHSDDVKKIRFLCGINEMLRTSDRKARSAKATKLISLFVKDDSRFHVEGIPSVCVKDLLHHRYQAFYAVRDQLMMELLKNPVVLEILLNKREKGTTFIITPHSCLLEGL
jgi:hypothetical protein